MAKPETPDITRVTAAILIKDDKIIIAKRKSTGTLPNKWEFPGGKMEEGESFSDTASRELKEELGLETVFVGSALYSVVDQSIGLEICFVPVGVRGEPVLYEHESFAWVSLKDLLALPLAPSDLSFAKSIS